MKILAVADEESKYLWDHFSPDKLRDVDLILVEGYKQQDLPRVGLCRKATGKGLPCDAAAYIALVTDDEALRARSAVPCFGFEDAAPLAEFLLRYTGLRR